MSQTWFGTLCQTFTLGAAVTVSFDRILQWTITWNIAANRKTYYCTFSFTLQLHFTFLCITVHDISLLIHLLLICLTLLSILCHITSLINEILVETSRFSDCLCQIVLFSKFCKTFSQRSSSFCQHMHFFKFTVVPLIFFWSLLFFHQQISASPDGGAGELSLFSLKGFLNLRASTLSSVQWNHHITSPLVKQQMISGCCCCWVPTRFSQTCLEPLQLQ